MSLSEPDGTFIYEAKFIQSVHSRRDFVLYSKLCAAKAVVEDDFTLPDTWPSIVSLVTCAAA